MKIPKTFKEGLKTAWQGLTVVVAGLLMLDFLICLVAALAALGWLMNQAGLIVFTAVLLLVGIFLFLPGKRIGVDKWPRRLLGAGLICGGLVLIFFVVMYIAAVFSMLEYIRQVKTSD